MNTPRADVTGPKHFAALDTLRGVAALSVAAHHTVQNFPATYGGALIARGEYGVQLFYIVSAYSLCLSLSQRKQAEHAPIRNYALRRVFRIAPLFYLALILYLLKPFVFPASTANWMAFVNSWTLQPWHVLITALFLNGWHYQTINYIVPVGWSVAVESNFYFCLPLLYAWAGSLKRSLWLLGALLFFAAACRKLLYLTIGPSIATVDEGAFGRFAQMWLPAQLSVFMLGIVLFRAIDSSALPSVAKLHRRLLAPITTFLVGLLTLALMPMAATKLFSDSFNAGVAMLGIGWLIMWYPARVLVNPITRHLGKISYSLYLLHWMVIQCVIWLDQVWFAPRFGARMPYSLAFTCVALLSTGLSTLTYHLVEVPGQALGARLIRRLQARDAAKSALGAPALS